MGPAKTMTPDQSVPAHYSADAVEKLIREHASVDAKLEQLLVAIADSCVRLANVRAKEFLLNGVARRLRFLRRSLQKVFELFPPSSIRPIDTDDLDDAQISLHAFVINLYGLFDNLAWAFV